MSFNTITLKLHNPGREKRRILEEAMGNYTRSFDFLLREAGRHRFDPEGYRSGGKYALAKWVDRDLTARLSQFHAEPFKDSLKLDFAMTFSGYLELKAKGKKVGFPGAYTDPSGNLTNLRPIFFCRYDTKRDYCLLYDAQKRRYFVKLYLLNHHSARERAKTAGEESRLEHVHKSGLKLERRASKERFIIVPLAFGRWQESYLTQCLEHPEILKTARLIKRGGEFFITINLNLPAKEKVKPLAFMGISRGPENSVSFTVADETGGIKESGRISLKESFALSGRPSSELYRAAGQIVDVALGSSCRVILENLTDYTDGIYAVDFDCGKNQNILSKSSYFAFGRLLDYKLEFAGLPKPVRVSPFGIFSTCPRCGLNTKKSRSSKGVFLCVSCGAAYSIRDLGSVNLAVRLIKYSTDDIKIKVLKEDGGIRLQNEILGLDLRVSGTEDIMTRLSGELSDIIQETKINKGQLSNRQGFKKKWSMIQKIEGFDDFTKHITFI